MSHVFVGHINVNYLLLSLPITSLRHGPLMFNKSITCNSAFGAKYCIRFAYTKLLLKELPAHYDSSMDVAFPLLSGDHLKNDSCCL